MSADPRQFSDSVWLPDRFDFPDPTVALRQFSDSV